MRWRQIHANARNPQLMAKVAAAVAEKINRRGLRRGKQRLEFELLLSDGRGS